MRSAYVANTNNPYHIAYRNATLQKKIAQLSYHKRQQIPLNPKDRYSPSNNIDNKARCSSAPTQTPVDSFIKFEKSQLPHYVVPVLYTPERVIEREELAKNDRLDQLFQKKSYEKLYQGIPVTCLGENKLIPYKNYCRNLTHSTSLSQYETEVYSKLMKNMYGKKDIKVNSRGDYSQKHSQQTRTERPRQSINHLANRLKRMYLNYNNPNYQSDSENSSMCEEWLQNHKVQTEQVVQEEDTNATVNNPSNSKLGGTLPTMSKDNIYYQTVGYENYGNISKRYAHYGILEENEREKCTGIEIKSPTLLQAKALNQEGPNRNDDIFNESKSTQTLSVARPTSRTKETQTSINTLSRNRFPDRLKKNITINKNAPSEANITVIIDRGWKEDVYSIAGGLAPSNSSVTKSESVSVIDLLPVVPCLQLKDKEVVRDMSPPPARPTLSSGVNTNISLCSKRKQKPKRLVH